MRTFPAWLDYWGNAGAAANVKADLDHDNDRRDHVAGLAVQFEAGPRAVRLDPDHPQPETNL